LRPDKIETVAVAEMRVSPDRLDGPCRQTNRRPPGLSCSLPNTQR
jgi:hypothetical protein